MTGNDTTLLAHLGPWIDETLATKALAYVLNRSAPCRQALEDLLRDAGVSIDSIERVRPEVTGPTGKGRADIACMGLDPRVPLALLEVKFDAVLTRNQPTGYLDWLLENGRTSALIFLVPESRAELLWTEVRDLARRAGKRLADVDLLRRCVCVSGTKCYMMLVTWGELLDTMLARVVVQGDWSGVEEDLRQLRGLAQFKDAAQPPFTVDYLQMGPDIENPRPQDLKQVISDAVDRAVRDGWADVSGLRTSRPSSLFPYGRYFRFSGTPLRREVWLGVNNERWKDSNTPLWLWFTQADYGLAEMIRDWQPGSFEEGFLPIDLKPQVELAQVVESVVGQLSDLSRLLKSY